MALVLVVALALGGALRRFVSPPTLEEQVMSIAADLRCPVCQGESVAQSDATASVQIRGIILADLQKGESRQQILQAISGAYGAWILERPPARGLYVVLWLVPALAFFAVLGLILWYVRSRGVSAAADENGSPPTGPPPEADPHLAARLRRYL